MVEEAPERAWVEIHAIILPAGQRAAQVPEDTQRVPLEMRVKGFLAQPAVVGDEVEIVTVVGRRLRGTLVMVNPPYTHSFGSPIAELLTVGREVCTLLGKRERV
jgi:hypothetical protein